MRAGIDSIEHGIFMDERCLEEMLAARTYLVPTIAALKNILAHADEGIPDYVVEKARRVADRHRQSIAMYYQAGGPIALGTDAGTPFNRHGNNALELAYMVEFGMTPADALIAGTSRGAALMGLDDRGVVDDGMRADLLLVEGNPVQNIGQAADPAHHRAIYKNGVPVPQRRTAPS